MKCRLPMRIGAPKGDGVNYVEWIKNDGNSYFDLGVKANQDTRVVCEFEYTAGTMVFGGRNGWKNKDYAFNVSGATYNTSSSTFTTLSTSEKHTVDFNKNVVQVDGVTQKTFTYGSFSGDYNLFLFAVNEAGTADQPLTGTAYICKVYQNDVLVRDCRPCLDPDGAACLYDEISKTYIYGVGTFTAGASIGDSMMSYELALKDPSGYFVEGFEVVVDGTSYSEEKTFTLQKGKTIILKAPTYSGNMVARVNGQVVADINGGSYAFAITSNTVITIFDEGDTAGFDITTE